MSLWASGQGIERAFQDVFDLAEHCRFRDCKHEDEPGCAVRAAVAAGRLDPRRLRSLTRLVAEEAALEEEQRPAGTGTATAAASAAAAERSSPPASRRPRRRRSAGLPLPAWTSPSPIAASTTARPLLAFMDECIYPNEGRYDAEIARER